MCNTFNDIHFESHLSTPIYFCGSHNFNIMVFPHYEIALKFYMNVNIQENVAPKSE